MILKYRFDRKSGQTPFRSESKPIPPNASFFDGVATKDIIIDDFTGLSIRIFLPESSIQSGSIHGYSWMMGKTESSLLLSSFSSSSSSLSSLDEKRKSKDKDKDEKVSSYLGYMPQEGSNNHKLPIIVQFHAGGFVIGRKDTPANDTFCRRMAKVCNCIVVSVGYRLAPENKYPAAYDDGYQVLKWLSHEATLINNDTSPALVVDKQGKQPEASDVRDLAKSLIREVVDPWLQMHADFSRVILLGVSSGANIANSVARRASSPMGVEELGFLSVVAQVLLYPLFGGVIPTPSEVKLADTSYFYDKSTLNLVWKLFLDEEEFSLDHPAINPLIEIDIPQKMPPTLLITAEHDMLRDRAMAYSVLLKKWGIDSQVNDYKDVVHGFASAEPLLNTPQAESCAEDISMWIHRHIAPKNGELSY